MTRYDFLDARFVIWLAIDLLLLLVNIWVWAKNDQIWQPEARWMIFCNIRTDFTFIFGQFSVARKLILNGGAIRPIGLLFINIRKTIQHIPITWCTYMYLQHFEDIQECVFVIQCEKETWGTDRQTDGGVSIDTFRSLRFTAEGALTDGNIPVWVHDFSGHPTVKRRLRNVPNISRPGPLAWRDVIKYEYQAHFATKPWHGLIRRLAT